MIVLAVYLSKATAHHTGKLLRAAHGVTKDSGNDERDLAAKFIRWGLSMPVNIEEIIHGKDHDAVTTHWVRPSSWVKELMRLYPGSLTGGLTNINEIGLQLKSFWRLYRQFHGEHSMFSLTTDSKLERMIPLALFGDEGRGPKRGQILIWSLESVLGLDDLPNDFKCKCKEGLTSIPATDVLTSENEVPGSACPEEFRRACRQSTNNKNHSFLTRHVLFGLPHWQYKSNPDIEKQHIALMVDDLNTLFSSGVEVGGTRWFGCVVGAKGDFKHHVSVGNLDRSYNTIGLSYGNLMCSFCLAGAPGFPFETIEHSPVWEKTLYSSRPWVSRPMLTNVVYDELKPEHLMKLDVFHLFKIGLGRDLAGSGVIIFCRIGLFDWPDSRNDLTSRLNRAHGSFRLWCLTHHKSPGLQSFSKSFFSLKSYADSPWSNSKGSDTMLLLRWLHFVSGLHLASPTTQNGVHGKMLRFFQKTLEHSFELMEIGNTHALWLPRGCAKHMYGRFFLLLRGYRCLASEAMALNFSGFAMKPKLHGMAHIMFDLRQQLLRKNQLILNPWAWNNESNEDTVGRVARLSRKVSTRTITKRTLQRYFLKKKIIDEVKVQQTCKNGEKERCVGKVWQGFHHIHHPTLSNPHLDLWVAARLSPFPKKHSPQAVDTRSGSVL